MKRNITVIRRILTYIIFICAYTSVYAQDYLSDIYVTSDTLEVYFRLSDDSLDPQFKNNGANLRAFAERYTDLMKDSGRNVRSILVVSGASPEGSTSLNQSLSDKRAEVVFRYMVEAGLADPEDIEIESRGIDWKGLTELVRKSSLAFRDDVLEILGQPEWIRKDGKIIDGRKNMLMRYDDGKAWKELQHRYFQDLRATRVMISYSIRKESQAPVEDVIVAQEPSSSVLVAEEPGTPVEDEPDTIPSTEGWSRKLHVKTNVIGLAGAIANAGVEVDLGRHWSFNLPVYYSSWNYFRETLKFRTLAIQPEFRYWISEDNDGFYAGAHFGTGYYNFAFGGDYRYQDHDGRTPALGGGISLGYRLPMGRDSRWRVEFSLGAGGYSLHYDVFHNTAETKDGLMTGSVRRTYWGIDQAAVSFSYSFDLKRKGGRR